LLPSLWKQAAIFEMENGNYKKAEELLRDLLHFAPEDVLGIALRMTVYIHVRLYSPNKTSFFAVNEYNCLFLFSSATSK